MSGGFTHDCDVEGCNADDNQYRPDMFGEVVAAGGLHVDQPPYDRPDFCHACRQNHEGDDCG